MKHVYTKLCIIALFSLFSFRSAAQCTCSGGAPADSVVQEVTLSGILPFTSTVLFNKLDPAIGTLSCVSTRTWVTTILNIDIVNRDTTSRVTYTLDYKRNTGLSGPGISVTAQVPRIYGPYDLGQAGVDPDTAVHIGPDTIFNNTLLVKQTSSSLGSYSGVGTVSFTYTNNAIYGFTSGNDNNKLEVAAVSDVKIRVVYYYCPLVILANKMRNFTTSRNNNSLSLSWETDNEAPGNRYEIEGSENGKDFSTIASISSKGAGLQEYHYEMMTGSTKTGKMYYRIKLIDKDNNVTYSAYKLVYFGDNGDIQPSAYPNPVTTETTIRFANPQTGMLTAELVSMNGQVLQSRQFRGNRLTSLQFTLNRKYPQGTYWLRVRNGETGNQATQRLFIQ